MLKVLAKKLIGSDHWSYLSWYKDRFGYGPALRTIANMVDKQSLGVVPNPVNGGFVFLRPGTADQTVYDEVFLDHAYDIDLDNPATIIDAGAHIGLSSVFFASKFPKATIIAIEPELSNFDLLLANVKKFPNIKPIRAGLWNKKTHLRIQDENVATWSFQVSEDSSGRGIPALGVADLMSECEIANIDVLKMDIEGSELEVFNEAQAWLPAVKTLIIELHDRYRPGCSTALAKALTPYAYDQRTAGENLVITNLRKLAA